MWLDSDHFNTLVVSFVFVFLTNAVTNCIDFIYLFISFLWRWETNMVVNVKSACLVQPVLFDHEGNLECRKTVSD